MTAQSPSTSKGGKETKSSRADVEVSWVMFFGIVEEDRCECVPVQVRTRRLCAFNPVLRVRLRQSWLLGR